MCPAKIISCIKIVKPSILFFGSLVNNFIDIEEQISEAVKA
jgi:hypothetical protein